MVAFLLEDGQYHSTLTDQRVQVMHAYRPAISADICISDGLCYYLIHLAGCVMMYLRLHCVCSWVEAYVVVMCEQIIGKHRDNNVMYVGICVYRAKQI